MRKGTALAALLLAACQQPEAGEAVASIDLEERAAPSEPIASPDVEGAAWQMSADGRTARFGKPGAPVLFSLACESPGRVQLVRHAPADAEAKAMMAWVGAGIARIPVDASQTGGGWQWEGELPASDARLDVIASGNATEITVPGAGSLMASGSPAPRRVIEACALRG